MAVICEAYTCHMPWSPCRRICPQCTLETVLFNQYQSRGELSHLVRHLEDMLVLTDAQRPDYSFLCAGEGWMHGPIALATVDPAVVRLDMHCAPPDRWHGVVDMIDDMTGAVRKGLKARLQAEVYGCTGRSSWLAIMRIGTLWLGLGAAWHCLPPECILAYATGSHRTLPGGPPH